jgi:integrase
MPLTMKAVRELRPDTKKPEYTVWDTPGFGVRVRRNGVTTYVVKFRNHLGEQRKMTLGSPDKIPLAQARKKAQKLIAEAKLGGDPAKARAETRRGTRVSDLAERWIESREADGRKPTTLRAYRWNLDNVIVPRFGNRIARTLTSEDVRQLYFKVRDEGKPYLANRVLATLSSMLGWAKRRDLIPDNVAAGAVDRQDRGKEKPNTRHLSEGEVHRFLSATRTLKAEGGNPGRMAAGFELMLLCGLRPSDVYGLKWSEIDFEAGLIRFESDKTEAGTPAYLRAPAAALLGGLKKTDAMYVFPSPRQTGRSVHDGRKVWAKIVELAKFDDPTPSPKSLRKSHGSLARNWRHDLGAISKSLRHASQSTTEKHYAFLGDPLVAAEQDVIQQKIAALANPKAKVVELKK